MSFMRTRSTICLNQSLYFFFTRLSMHTGSSYSHFPATFSAAPAPVASLQPSEPPVPAPDSTHSPATHRQWDSHLARYASPPSAPRRTCAAEKAVEADFCAMLMGLAASHRIPIREFAIVAFRSVIAIVIRAHFEAFGRDAGEPPLWSASLPMAR